MCSFSPQIRSPEFNIVRQPKFVKTMAIMVGFNNEKNTVKGLMSEFLIKKITLR